MSLAGLLFGILAPKLVPPFQQTRIGCHERRLMCDGGRDDEPVGRIAVQAFEIAGKYCNIASEWNLIDPRVEDHLSQVARRIDRSQSSFGNEISQKLITLMASRSAARASSAMAWLRFPSPESVVNQIAQCVSSKIT